MIQTIRPSGVADDILTGDESAKDAVNRGFRESSDAAEILNPQTCSCLTENLDQLNCLDDTWDEVTGVSGPVRTLQHINASRHSDVSGADEKGRMLVLVES